MSDKSPSLRQVVHQALKQERQIAKGQNSTLKAKRFGIFLQASLENLGLNADEMARRLGLDPELAQALLDGMLPSAEIDDELLREIAKLLQHPAPTLGLLLGRELPEETTTGQEARRKL